MERIKVLETKQKTRKLGEIFSDYKTNANIKYAEIVELNVSKKTNTLEVVLYFDEYIEIKEIWYFEKFLQERFKFQYIDIKIKYHEKVEKKGIREEWRNIIAYMAHKYPLTKPMLLLKSDIEELNNKITVKMHIKGADFLRAKKTDKELAKVLKNLYGIDYKIELTEEITKEQIEKIKQDLKKQEEQIIAKIEEENQQLKEQMLQSKDVPEYNDVDYAPPTNLEEDIPNIMGKPSKAKEKHIKIKDITANEGRVTLEGRLVTSDVRETKSGKGMIIFELYDGSRNYNLQIICKRPKRRKRNSRKIAKCKSNKNNWKSWVRHICRRCYSNCKHNYGNNCRSTRTSKRRRTRGYTTNFRSNYEYCMPCS